jgi:hypothetical protein
MDNSGFDAANDLARTAAVVTANRARICRRDNCMETAGLDRRGLCKTHQAIRLATMRADTVNLAERPVRKTAITIASLLSGPSGFAQVQGADLDHCNAAMSGRASLISSMKNLGALENFIQQNPANSEAAWHNYLQIYSRCERIAQDVKHHESCVKATHPDLVLAPLRMPKPIKQQPEREWMEI